MPAIIILSILVGGFVGAANPEQFQLVDPSPEVEVVDEWEGV